MSDNLRKTASDILSGRPGTRPMVIAGPCSAETERQTVATASALARTDVKIFRAGIWKPRTHPGGFEGAGTAALPWLMEARSVSGLPVATEVASPGHVRVAAGAGVDVFWIGSRTASDPFAVQAIADEMRRHSDIPVLVKNPLAPDLELWIGAIERLTGAGVRTVCAVHRGFHLYGEKLYRNAPVWSVPIEFQRRMPGVLLLHDPSHVSGDRALVGKLCRQAMEIGFDGLMVEAHISPAQALSDARQQLEPKELLNILRSLTLRKGNAGEPLLADLRREIDRLDTNLVELLSERMKICREIGKLKAEMNIPVVQSARYRDLMESKISIADHAGVGKKALEKILEVIHEESVRQQLEIVNRRKPHSF